MLELGMVDVSGRSDGNGERCLPARLPGSITRLIYSLGLSALQAESTSVDLSQLIFRNLVMGNIVPVHCLLTSELGFRGGFHWNIAFSCRIVFCC
jgi:hypothetical protein